jgi:hypothetical protein
MALRFVRLRAGCGPERARVVHLTDVGTEVELRAFSALSNNEAGGLRVLCGLYLVPGTFDILPGVAGMPCESCAINSPGAEAPRQLAV